MTSLSQLNPDTGARPCDPKSRRNHALRSLLRWSVPTAICLLLAVLACFSALDASGQLNLVVRWLLIALLAVASSICTPRFAILTTAVTLLTWSWIELQGPGGFASAPGQMVRFVVVMSTISWLAWLRAKLTAAERVARVDSLTELPNRQAIIEALKAELSRARRFDRPFSIAMLDCDGFKQINDQHGHLAGDEILRKIGVSLRQQTRPFDCAGRWGGDEFLIVLSEVDQSDAQLIAERLRATMRHHVERDFPSLTFSMGVITILDPVLEWDACVELADQAMYTSKHLGRDQTRFEVVSSAPGSARGDQTSTS
jgi:diguanylate cyclase (GGDEF)-like protein